MLWIHPGYGVFFFAPRSVPHASTAQIAKSERYRFFGYFDYAFGKHQYNGAAFQLHQATERFLNAVLLTFARYKPKTHDIERLDRQARNLHVDFFTVFPRGNDQQKRCFDLLRKAYIDARYKRDYTITKEELEYLAARVRKLRELTKRICAEKIAGMA